MQIQDSQSMIQHLESGSNLMLDKQGQLETQSAAGHFFQKIGDAFRSLTSSGRAAIETRNANLHAAMANMLRDSTLVNSTQGEISPPATKTERNSLAMRLGMAQALRNFPQEARAAARNLGLELLRLQGLPEKGNSAEARGKALEVMNKIRGDEVVFNALHCDYTRTHEQLEIPLSEMSKDLHDEFMGQKDHRIKENGMHQSYLEDAHRGTVRSINGNPPNMADLEGEFIRLISDEKFRSFLSMMASQAGLQGAVPKQLWEPGRTPDNPDIPKIPALPDLASKNMVPLFPNNQIDIRVEGGKARIMVETDITISPMLKEMDRRLGIHSTQTELKALRALPSPEMKPIGGMRYVLELVVDLTQDMTDKEIPDFTLENASREPITFPPPVSIRPEA